MNLFLKILAAVAMIVIVIVGLSVSYYYVIFLPQQENTRIELQREKELADQAQQQETQTNAAILKQEAQSKAEEMRANQQALLDRCLLDAQRKFVSEGQALSTSAKSCDQKTGVARTACQEVHVEAFAKNDTDLQQDKNNCFKQYPQ